MTHNTDKVFLD